ncbi:hypothetical protein IX27_00350 [Streptomyces sp. JS01]|uniref:hypothetical protein n=1 Tax=Streptomyces sp. JS01 TaxID=1525753 RepID=UPI0005033B9F|nr:hypothetical protein [Streptomyces sp. JS01]KFK91517.1 hypothetical protein IX27_00350 [Streptomyces sp. JS01]
MTERRPGQWPVVTPVELAESDEQGEQHLALTKAQAAWVMPLESIRVHLGEQPSIASIRTTERRLKAEIGNLADAAVRQLKKAG